jgi:hypothetical protein
LTLTDPSPNLSPTIGIVRERDRKCANPTIMPLKDVDDE